MSNGVSIILKSWTGRALVIALLAGGCSKQPDPAAAPQAPKKEWSWNKYPLIPKMRLATVSCQIQPRNMLSIPSPVAGLLRVHLDQPQTNLAKDFVFAEFEPEVFREEAEGLEFARAKIEEREKFQRELEIPRQKIQLNRQISETERQLAVMELVSTNLELGKFMFYSPSMGDAMRPEALDQKRIELELFKKSLHYVEATNLAFMGVDLASARTEWLRQKVAFDRRHQQARIKMPFDGQLTLSIPVTDGVQEYLVQAGQELAVARDLSAIRARVAIANAAWAGIPPETIEATVRLPSGEEMRGKYAFQKIERQGQREESVYYFYFPEEKSAAAARLLGTDVSCELWVNLPRAARIVPKLALLLEKPEAFENRPPWAVGVETAFPGARVLAEGTSEIAILEPGAAAPTPAKQL